MNLSLILLGICVVLTTCRDCEPHHDEFGVYESIGIDEAGRSAEIFHPPLYNGVERRAGGGYTLLPQEKEFFFRNGYLVLRGFVGGEGEENEKEWETIEPHFTSLISGTKRNEMKKDFCDMSSGYEKNIADFALINAMLPRVYEPQLKGNIYEKRAADVVRQLFSSPHTIDYDQLLAKKPHHSSAKFSWHQGRLLFSLFS
jgi:hypothetical protein